jgi:hypothetical protein|tara:strand:- start:2897 stop:2998 length:102 start_codon:yes stop_codon:yes gene_type:complete
MEKATVIQSGDPSELGKINDPEFNILEVSNIID